MTQTKWTCKRLHSCAIGVTYLFLLCVAFERNRIQLLTKPRKNGRRIKKLFKPNFRSKGFDSVLSISVGR